MQDMDEGLNPEANVVVAVLDIIDMIAVIFFTLEYFIRFIVAPRKWKFFIVRLSRNYTDAYVYDDQRGQKYPVFCLAG